MKHGAQFTLGCVVVVHLHTRTRTHNGSNVLVSGSTGPPHYVVRHTFV